MKATRRRAGERGASVIEFVLVAPLFLMLMLGAVDWGWYFVLRETVVNATREGARVASVQENPPAQSQTAAVATVRAYLQRVNAPGAVPVQSPVVGCTTIGGTAVQAVSVTLSNYPSPPISGLRLTLVPTTITAQTVMRLEIQTPCW